MKMEVLSMQYLSVRCRSCEKEFAVERVDSSRQAVQFRRSSFKASYICPRCGAAEDYGSEDLGLYDGDVDGGSPATTPRWNAVQTP
jgi:DNA-directed RNA polymerase subunit RPC12/RpoP